MKDGTLMRAFIQHLKQKIFKKFGSPLKIIWKQRWPSNDFSEAVHVIEIKIE